MGGNDCSLWKKDVPGPVLSAANRRKIPSPRLAAAAIAAVVNTTVENRLENLGVGADRTPWAIGGTGRVSVIVGWIGCFPLVPPLDGEVIGFGEWEVDSEGEEFTWADWPLETGKTGDCTADLAD
jgi:hypothetical protein